MKKIGPYELGETISEDALVGINILCGQLFTLVGDIELNDGYVPAYTDRQNIDTLGQVTSPVYSGPPIRTRVMIWNKIHD